MIKFPSRKDLSSSINMTPVIDIVFLLMIFFMLLCQFIVAENFDVNVPDSIHGAQEQSQNRQSTTTVTVMTDEKGNVSFAVGSEIVEYNSSANLVASISKMIDDQLTELSPNKRVVTLRTDRSVNFADAKYALAGISKSTATDVKLSVIRDKK